MKQEFETILKELDELTKIVIMKSQGDDVLSIQLLGQVKQVIRDMGKHVVDIQEQYVRLE